MNNSSKISNTSFSNNNSGLIRKHNISAIGSVISEEFDNSDENIRLNSIS